MHEQVTVVGPKADKNLDFTVDEPAGSPGAERSGPKFVYAGGDKPLDGYTIKRGVGQGGFGEIYYALSDAGKEVALKLIRRNLDIELRGIRHCLNLKHPNLLALYDIRQDEHGDTWIVMEFVGGECLESALAANPDGMPIESTLAWFHGLGAGVAYLHDRGIVHRDLKPANVFSDEGLVKVGDYGLSKFISCSRRSGQTESVGTVHYMAPEVANGRYGKEIDIYALGIILYEMLTGQVPFEGESVGEVLMKHLTATADVSMLSEPYRSVVARALEKDPAKRFDSVGEMVAALPQPVNAPPGTARLPSGSGRPGGSAKAAAGSEKPIGAELADDEPILRALRENFGNLRQAWDDANLNTPVKVCIAVACVFTVVAAPWLVPMAVFLVVLYGGYRIVRTVVLANQASENRPSHGHVPPVPRTPPPAVRPASDPPPKTPPKRHRWRRPKDEAAAALVVKPLQERLTELIGSLVVGALVALAMCVMIIVLYSYDAALPGPELCAWLALVSVAGTWAVLIPSKFWEGTRGETTPRRFVMMIFGLGLGLVACGLADVLMINFPRDPLFQEFSPGYDMPTNFYEVGSPLVLAYLGCFGTLFLLIRWWRGADPLRGTRLSLWSLAVTVVVTTVVAGLWHFPQPWLPMVAAAVCVSTQLSTPWINPRRRVRHDHV